MGWHAIHAANASLAASVLSAVPLHKPVGPVVVGSAPGGLGTHAHAAAAVWNAYLPGLPQKTYNLQFVNLPGDVVGRIWVPCNASCSVQIDPSYSAPFNVILHEFGHGIGLPYGAASGIGSVVDGSNHWAPESVDAGELMTATLQPTPHLALYTLNAMSPTHEGCYVSADCSYAICDAPPVHLGPGLCRPRYYHLETFLPHVPLVLMGCFVALFLVAVVAA